MNAPLIISIISAVITAAVCTASLYALIHRRRQIDRLADSIEDFIANGEKTQYSMSDNSFSRLQNSVADLQNLIDREKSRTAAENKKVNEFISDISHQLKTPLAGLRLYCEMDEAQSPGRYTAKELQLVERMERLVFKLLRLEKIRTDSYSMNFELQALSGIINDVIGVYAPLFPEKEFSVTGDSVLRCDREWLAEAIGNIVKNACEHTRPDATVRIAVSETKRSAAIEISDDGGGLDNEKPSDLFTRFYRSNNAAPGSTGIGMAITKAIVEKHHGIISAENKNGGLSITMCFPLIDGYEAL